MIAASQKKTGNIDAVTRPIESSPPEVSGGITLTAMNTP